MDADATSEPPPNPRPPCPIALPLRRSRPTLLVYGPYAYYGAISGAFRFFEQLTEFLAAEKGFDVRRVQGTHVGPGGFTTRYVSEGMPGISMVLEHSDYVVECPAAREMVAISAMDDPVESIETFLAHPWGRRLCISQTWAMPQYRRRFGSNPHFGQIKPFIYFPGFERDYEAIFRARQEADLIPKLFFRGAIYGFRGIVQCLRRYDAFVGGDKVDDGAYVQELTRYAVALALPGGGDMNNREIEHMAMGIPFLRFEYAQPQLSPPLLPDVHYISVPHPPHLPRREAHPWTGLWSEEHYPELARSLIAHFQLVIRDPGFVAFVARSARAYYEAYLSPARRLEHAYELLGLRAWETR